MMWWFYLLGVVAGAAITRIAMWAWRRHKHLERLWERQDALIEWAWAISKALDQKHPELVTPAIAAEIMSHWRIKYDSDGKPIAFVNLDAEKKDDE
jgi:hypothetical protein